MWEHLQIGWRPVVEILILTVGIYYAFRFIRGTRGAPVVTGFLVVLLAWITLHPVLPAGLRRLGVRTQVMPETLHEVPAAPLYRTIMVPLDHTDRDRAALAHAGAIGRQHGSKLLLVHVEEGATSQVYGPMASTREVEEGREYLDRIAAALRTQGMDVETVVLFSTDPHQEIVRIARERKPDLLVMGAHGHKGLQDLIFGTTINAVRHDLSLPLLIVRDEN